MKNKKILWIALIVAFLLQLYIPVKMILDKEDVLKTGKEYKFKTAPIDPIDPFRGKYIVLNYENNEVVVENEKWKGGEPVYVTFTEDNNGFAKIKSIAKKAPKTPYFLKTKIKYIRTHLKQEKVIIEYPFDRYYMEESKAYEAEKIHQESQINTAKKTYAVVYIKGGKATLNDVRIDGVSIKEIVIQNRPLNK